MLNNNPIDADFWEQIADSAEDLARLTGPHSKTITRLLELVAIYALELKEQQN